MQVAAQSIAERGAAVRDAGQAMSALGQKQTFAVQNGMSAPEATFVSEAI
jgi:hypothetical protein